MLRGRWSFLTDRPWVQYPNARTPTGKLFGEKCVRCFSGVSSKMLSKSEPGRILGGSKNRERKCAEDNSRVGQQCAE